ncbi:uncharacterized protein LOC128887612 [Hylaeus anthracinus]|uniref:uncharacterized protein LOC128887612 n=1 Tax=Hylaeus anthracinus TaxID=313031 RepID=UPI0023B9F783|nr:uncharacterized protein LOC128887612 [Hylaeus anthracinus]XP_053999675.1 uncharacterized protein LOC128887612 [Hylaeus anthracinus]
MRITCVLIGLSLAVAFVASSPVVKREAESEDLSPFNEVYVVEADDEQGLDDDRSDRDKRKIGVVKLGVSNGIINFVFGKLDSFIDSKTKALAVLDDANKAKNAAYGIDTKHSATSKFINDLVAAKIQATSGSVGPVINSATTFLAGAKNGLADAFASKLAPLSSLSSGIVSSLSAGPKPELGAGVSLGVSGDGHGGSGIGILGNILSSKLGTLSTLNQNNGGGSDSHGNDASVGVNLGGFANLGGGVTISTTTEDIPEFDRMRVSLDVPPSLFGGGFTVITNISKIVSSVILNSARRTQTLLELFKPFFRGTFAIKGLPSDNPH